MQRKFAMIKENVMARTVSVGVQNFEKIISRGNFYVDKTLFIKEWWESDDEVTLITRPRRFGKTLNMNMLERFFSVKFMGKGEVFEGLNIWKEEKYRELQGTYPVVFLTFADVKQDNFDDAVKQIKANLWRLYEENRFLLESEQLSDLEKEEFKKIRTTMDDTTAQDAVRNLMQFLERHYKKNVILVLDEYDTPLQEAYVGGYWKEIVAFTRSMFNSMFKTNPYLERAIMTGITRVSKESLFSDLNNLKVISITSNKYASYFGFTEEEVFAAMDEFGITNKDEVRKWYDGFTIGNLTNIYNPWSVINFLDEDRLKPYWVNTSSNKLVSDLVKDSDKETKMQFEQLLQGETIWSEIDEEIVFNKLTGNGKSVWSLFLASGYLKTIQIKGKKYELAITNYEVRQMFEEMVVDWFDYDDSYNGFIKALLRGNLKEMNAYMKRVCFSVFSSFDGGTHPSEFTMPEKFYHGFVLGLLVNLMGRYELTSNRESGFGRYDVMLRPLNKEDDAIIMEFKVYDADGEGSLDETVQAALRQIEEKEYEQILIDAGMEKERIRRYGFAFEGKRVLIGE